MQEGIYESQWSLGSILSKSWELFTQNFKSILIITLIVYIPVNIILYFVPINESLSFRQYVNISRLLESLIGVISTMAVAYLIKNKIDGKDISFREALKKSTSRWGVAVYTNLMFGVLVALLTLLLIVPGIIFSIYWVFATYVVVLKDLSGGKALDYSKSIVKNRWWKVFGYLIVFGLFGFIVGIVVGLLHVVIPEFMPAVVAVDTLIDIALSYFLVVSTVFFLNFDATKIADAPKQPTPAASVQEHNA